MVDVSASVIFPCTIKTIGSLLAPTHPGGPRERAVKQLWWCGVLWLRSTKAQDTGWRKRFELKHRTLAGVNVLN